MNAIFKIKIILKFLGNVYEKIKLYFYIIFCFNF